VQNKCKVIAPAVYLKIEGRQGIAELDDIALTRRRVCDLKGQVHRKKKNMGGPDVRRQYY